MLLNTLLSWRCGWLGVYAMWTDLLVFKGLPVVHAKEAINKTSLHPKHCVSLISSYLDLTHTHTPKSECMYKVTEHATPLAWFTLLHVCTSTWFTQQAEKALWGSEGTQCTAHTLFLSFPCFMCAGKSCHPLTFTMTTGIYMKTWLSTCCIRNMYNRSQDI